MLKNIPLDVFTNYLYKNTKFILVKDVKHTDNTFHYTIWFIKDIKNIYDLTPDIIIDLTAFIKEIKIKKIFENEKMFFTYPPDINRAHLHILPKNYISPRPLNELYNFYDINDILINITIIKTINHNKILSLKFDLYYEIGVVILKDNNNILENIKKIEYFKNKHNLNFIIIIRKNYENELIEYLFTNCQIINKHIISDNNYEKAITYDKILYI